MVLGEELRNEQSELEAMFEDLNIDDDDTVQFGCSKRTKVDWSKLNEDEVLYFGLMFAGFDEKRQRRASAVTNQERFKTFYGSNSLQVQLLWLDLLTTDISEAKTVGSEMNFLGFLIAQFFLRRYQPEPIMAGIFKLNEKSVRRLQWEFAKKIGALKKEKICLPKEWVTGKEIPSISFTIDGVHFLFHEVKHPTELKDKGYWSHKFNKPALAYDVAIDVHRAKVIHIFGPEPGGTSDLTMFREGLMTKMPTGTKGIADRGYGGEPEKLSIPSSQDDKEFARYKSRARSRHETFNTQIKFFSCLRDRFRHTKIDQHKICFEAVCVIVQHQMDHGDPIFDV
jgi:hypothetical protein